MMIFIIKIMMRTVFGWKIPIGKVENKMKLDTTDIFIIRCKFLASMVVGNFLYLIMVIIVLRLILVWEGRF